MSSDDLANIRDKIDHLDEQIISLIEQRAHYSINAAQIKRATEDNLLFYRPEREATILRNRLSAYQGILNKSDLAAILSNIISSCRAVQQQQTIAYLEPKGMNSYAAVLKHFGASVQSLTFSSLQAVFQAIEKDHAHFGVVPIKHSVTGFIGNTLDRLMASPLSICGEIKLNIGCCSLRFIVIGKQQIASSGYDKTTLALTTSNTADAFIHIMQTFSKQNINITSIESIPNKKNNSNYIFFIDIYGHQKDSNVRAALEELGNASIVYHILGSYPCRLSDDRC